MKKVILESVYLLCACCLAVLLPFGLTACSSDDKPFVDNEPIAAVNGGDVVKGINVSLSDFVSDVAGTRTTYADNDGGVKVTWAEADTIGIFPNQGGQVEFPIEAGTESNQATFDGGGWALKSNSTYSAYYPYRNANGDYGNKRIQLNFTGQKQADNGSTAHLGQYDYQATSLVKANNGYLNFQFKHLGALMKLQLTVPSADTFIRLKLTSSEKVFVTKAELDISGDEPVLVPTETSRTIILNLNRIQLTDDNPVLTAYLMLAPVDLSQGSLDLYLYNRSYYSFSATLTGHLLEAGKQYEIEKTLERDDSSSDIINFEDKEVKAICVANWDTDDDKELSYKEAEAVTDLGQAFRENDRIKTFDELWFFKGLTSIGRYAFFKCYNLYRVQLPRTLTSIDYYAFGICTTLRSIDIQNSVTNIESCAFISCNSLESITCRATTPPEISDNSFPDVFAGTIYVYNGFVEVYKAASVWKMYADKIQAI